LKNLTGQARGQGFRGSSEMLKNYKELKVWSYGSVCELETQILLAGDLDLIENRVPLPLGRGSY